MSSIESRTRTVFVGNLAYDLPEEVLAKHMMQAGPVVSAKIVFDKNTRRSKGFGFVEFADVAAAENAARILNDSRLYDRHLRVDFHAEKADDAAQEPPKKRRRVDMVLDEMQQLTVEELTGLSPAIRAQLLAMSELLKTLGKEHGQTK